MEENPRKEVDLKNTRDVEITDSNVKITVNPGESKTTGGTSKKTDYMSLVYIPLIILAVAVFIFMPQVRAFLRNLLPNF